MLVPAKCASSLGGEKKHFKSFALIGPCSSVAGLLCAHLHHDGAIQPDARNSRHWSLGTREVSEGDGVRRKLNMERNISNGPQHKLIAEKRANEHLKCQLKRLRTNVNAKRLDTPRLVDTVHGLEQELQKFQPSLERFQGVLKVSNA